MNLSLPVIFCCFVVYSLCLAVNTQTVNHTTTTTTTTTVTKTELSNRNMIIIGPSGAPRPFQPPSSKIEHKQDVSIPILPPKKLVNINKN